MKRARTLLLALSPIALLVAVIGFAAGNQIFGQAALTTAAVSFAIGLGAAESFAGYQFTAWIIAAVVSALCYPQYFLHLGPFNFGVVDVPSIDLRNKWVVLVIVQLVMFGMGTKMSLHDFVGVAKMPYPVFIGTALQFLVMPLTGWALTKIFNFPPEIAAGVILIGSCSSGLASNVMTYLAGADLALSVTLTAVGTLMSPILTPFWIYMLAGESVTMDFLSMMTEIIRIVLLPIGAAMLHDTLRRSNLPTRRFIFSVAIGCLIYLVSLAMGGWDSLAAKIPLGALQTSVMIAAGFIVGVVFHLLAVRVPWIESKVHVMSMFGIIYFTAVTTAAGRDNLLHVGMALLVVSILHNLIGWILGYWLSIMAGLDRGKAITVGFEVAMQNGGMASGLAGMMEKLGTVGLASAVFSPWMNVSGSVIANLIRRYAPIEPEEAKTETT
jgi:BASS family bile acid:Na+ symporter